MSNMSLFFSRLIGTLAVTLLLAGCIGGSSLFEKFFGEHRRYKDVILAGILGGLFGIYGNISGVTRSFGRRNRRRSSPDYRRHHSAGVHRGDVLYRLYMRPDFKKAAHNSSKAAVGFAYRRRHGTFSFRHCAGDGKTV